MPLEIKPGVGFAESTPGDCETFGALANTQLRAADGNAARAFNQSRRDFCALCGWHLPVKRRIRIEYCDDRRRVGVVSLCNACDFLARQAEGSNANGL